MGATFDSSLEERTAAREDFDGDGRLGGAGGKRKDVILKFREAARGTRVCFRSRKGRRRAFDDSDLFSDLGIAGCVCACACVSLNGVTVKGKVPALVSNFSKGRGAR